MHAWAIGGGILALAIWIYLAALRGGFWSVRADDGAPGSEPQPAGVVAVIPARDEAGFIGEAVRSLLAQEFPGELRVIVVDDGSSDGTAEMARRTAEDMGAAAGLTIVAGSERPEGWTGKLWSVEQGIAAAQAYRPDYLLLTDADIRHHPRSLARLVNQLGSGYDLVSHMVRLHCGTVAERLLIPAFVYFFFMLYPPAWIGDTRRRTAAAAGGCMLLRPGALEAAGGIAAVRGEIIDDCSLARAIKRSGGRVWLGLAARTESMRPYGSFAEIGRMIARTAFNQLGHSALALLVCVVGLMLTFLLPPALLGTRMLSAALLGVAAWLLMTVTYAPMVRFYRLNVLWALTLPLAAIFYLAASVDSALRYWSGRGGRWKGRVQDPAARTL